ncbi:MAG: Na+:solute symporter [Alphaproteobacteria bacterium]|nr:MAG: Na+:solute symporter [Alphaproteobacteria bacterium]
MHFTILDWFLIFTFPVISLVIGFVVSKKAGKDSASYFLSGRNMPWWLLGFSMVATTFSTDTPNLVTNIVRTNGVSGNWIWWAFLITGVVTAFIYAKLWRRSGVMTDLEFYEIRYSGKIAGYLRAFRALYLGVFFNVIIMSAVSLAAIKIAAIMIGTSPIETLVILGTVTMVFSAMGGFLGVVISDLVLFVGAMVGAIGASISVLDHPKIGGLDGLLSNPLIADKLSILPDFSNTDSLIVIIIMPLLIQWWSVWYPGAEPGGGGYIAQRMLAAKNGRHAMGAVIMFQIAHYALRPWPWIIVALASIIVYPDLDSLRAAFPDVPESAIGHDLAYSAMLTHLPPGLIGLVVASLIAAYMSTMSTSLNWGASYVVNDFYHRFVNPDASEKQLVRVGRISTVVMMIMTAVLALALSDALQVFNILLTIGAGTGLLFLLRWYWWRINGYSEIAAMVISFVVAIGLQFFAPSDWSGSFKLVLGVSVTTFGWLIVTYISPASNHETLVSFIRLVNPAGPGWARIRNKAKQDGETLPSADKGGLALALLSVPIACIGIYCLLFGVGYLIYGQITLAITLFIVSGVAGIFITRNWSALSSDDDLSS